MNFYQSERKKKNNGRKIDKNKRRIIKKTKTNVDWSA